MDARRHLSGRSGLDQSRWLAGNIRPLKIIAGAILVILLLLVVTTHSPQIDSNAAQPAAQSQGATDATFIGDYFPARFGSPRTSGAPEAHIQAF